MVPPQRVLTARSTRSVGVGGWYHSQDFANHKFAFEAMLLLVPLSKTIYFPRNLAPTFPCNNCQALRGAAGARSGGDRRTLVRRDA